MTKKLLVIIVIFGGIFIADRFFLDFRSWFRSPPPVVTKASITTLLKETSLKLLTNTTVTMVHCKLEVLPASLIGDIIFGKDEGLLIAKVSYSFGIDLNKISEDNVHIDDQSITITLPEPELLVCKVDTESIEIFTRTTLMRKISDVIRNRNTVIEMLKVLEPYAVEFARENGFEPTKTEIINNIEPFINKLIAAQTDKHVIFK